MTTDVLDERCVHHWVLTSSESKIGVCRSCGGHRSFGPRAAGAELVAPLRRSDLLSREALLLLADTWVEEFARLRTASVSTWGQA
jgi:hypothetical protein